MGDDDGVFDQAILLTVDKIRVVPVVLLNEGQINAINNRGFDDLELWSMIVTASAEAGPCSIVTAPVSGSA